MTTARCEVCGAEEYMPFRCKFCEGHFCARHRLPENHDCVRLEEHKERLRAEGKLMHPEPDLLEPRVSPRARASAWFGDAEDRVMRWLDGRAAMTFLVTIGIVFVLQLLVRAYDPCIVDGLPTDCLHHAIFVLQPDFYLQPWAIVTSIFSHGGFDHLFGNAIIHLFFGPTIERLIGTRRFVHLFLGAGVAAGLGQILVFSYLAPLAGVPAATGGVLGASGAIMGMLGALTLLAPRLTVYLMFILPMPLWLVTILYAAYDLLFVFDPSSNVAHVAHLIGLGLGLWYGKRLKDMGLRVRMGRQEGGVQWRDYL